ncbi:hypothetical protein KHC23_18565, partial [Ancylobacter dichloromethanicus]|uniref:hypothetical protein n=1 Tax=Ancylobacter dichloromethanicus TaxID=518825 RepID=UPI001BCA76CE
LFDPQGSPGLGPGVPAGRDTGSRGRARRERDRTVLEQLRSKLVFRNSFDAVRRVSQNRRASAKFRTEFR